VQIVCLCYTTTHIGCRTVHLLVLPEF